jgi:lipoic acid synthetase
MIMGGLCTRGCRFCSVQTGNPKGFLDLNEPGHTAEVVAAMNARYVVVTSVDRDDLEDSGAGHFAATIEAIRARTPETLVEVLIGDLGGKDSALKTLVDARPDMLAHNIETVRRLSRRVRDARANYDQSLKVLARAKELDPALPTKSSIMVGLGESEDEVLESMDDLRAHGVDALTVGQYLQPTPKHLKVEDFIAPETFQYYEHMGLLKGFRYVASGPLVRSSYKAGSFHKLAEMRRPNRNKGKGHG